MNLSFKANFCEALSTSQLATHKFVFLMKPQVPIVTLSIAFMSRTTPTAHGPFLRERKAKSPYLHCRQWDTARCSQWRRRLLAQTTKTSVRVNKVYLMFRVEVDEAAAQHGVSRSSEFASVYEGILANPEIRGSRVSVATPADFKDLKRARKF
ncbi:hypothetical protein Trco_003969 [Trichoderma cornu-damae]|uniref:Uncharacterized protein n=1 Tax=Trichoderma cornu-damae TaxID=654480 RepID=A0A9P8TTQ6_9HYPO|nr:hypothetical protein Trco_003969 [Trichoderma cornu-damae]